MRVVPAENGQEALRVLDHDAAIDIVLMDIMMPHRQGHAGRPRRREPRSPGLFTQRRCSRDVNRTRPLNSVSHFLWSHPRLAAAKLH